MSTATAKTNLTTSNLKRKLGGKPYRPLWGKNGVKKSVQKNIGPRNPVREGLGGREHIHSKGVKEGCTSDEKSPVVLTKFSYWKGEVNEVIPISCLRNGRRR